MTIASRTSRTMAVLSWALLGAVALGILLVPGAGGALPVVPWLGVLALLAWLVLWRPTLTVGEEGVTIGNVLRVVDVPWDALLHLDTKYALTLFTPGAKHAVWVAPQPGSIAGQRATREARRAEGEEALRASLAEGRRVVDLPGTESGDAAALVREGWDRARARGLGDPDAARVVTHWRTGAILALLGAAAAAVPLGALLAH